MKIIVYIILSLSVLSNLLLGLYVFGKKQIPPTYTAPPAEYKYLSPRIFMQNRNEILVNFIQLREQLKAYGEKKKGLGIYFEYLPSGVSIGVNEKQNYILASLLKTPMVMAVYKGLELEKWEKDDVLTIEKSDLDSQFGDLYTVGAGSKIKLEEAINLTITKSDNTAKSVLFSHLPGGSVDTVFDYLDIPKETDGIYPVVTPKNYSSILRSLYLSSYLEKSSSNEILELLTQSSFDDKLTAPIPKDIKVSHKIGVYEKDNPEKSVFTDCGIIYLPKRPYILCVMDRDSEANARTHISEVSKMIYDYISTY